MLLPAGRFGRKRELGELVQCTTIATCAETNVIFHPHRFGICIPNDRGLLEHRWPTFDVTLEVVVNSGDVPNCNSWSSNIFQPLLQSLFLSGWINGQKAGIQLPKYHLNAGIPTHTPTRPRQPRTAPVLSACLSNEDILLDTVRHFRPTTHLFVLRAIAIMVDRRRHSKRSNKPFGKLAR